MTVTELRQALEKLEAEGKGGVDVMIELAGEVFAYRALAARYVRFHDGSETVAIVTDG